MLASIRKLLIFAIFKSSLNLNLIRHWSENWCPGYLKHALSSSEIHLAVAKSLEIIGHVTNCCKRPIVLITIAIDSLMLSLSSIYAPNNQDEQMEFLQELNNCLIALSELTTLIVGGDWNCTLSKNDKIGGKPWKATNYRNLVLTTMDILDHVDIQGERHPKLRKYSYESKALKVKSRIDFFWSPKT